MGTSEENRENDFKVWQTLLLAKYDVQDRSDDVKLTKDDLSSRLNSYWEDPREWIKKLEIIMDKMKKLDPKYKQKEALILAQIYTYMPQLYNSKIVVLKCQEKSPIVKRDLHSKWQEKYGRKGDEDTKREGQ